MGSSGSVGFMFERKGTFTIPKDLPNPEEFELEIIDAGAEDIYTEGDYYIITTSLEDFGKVHKRLEKLEIIPENAQLQRIPTTTKKLSDEDAFKVLRTIEEFEDEDDVQNVYHNLEITDQLLNSYEE
jgi:transcriptional/translational regulatory protein YebC/TACO1